MESWQHGRKLLYRVPHCVLLRRLPAIFSSSTKVTIYKEWHGSTSRVATADSTQKSIYRNCWVCRFQCWWISKNCQHKGAWKLHFVRIVLTVCQSALLLCHRGHLKANSWFPHSQGFVECSRKFTSSIKWIFVLRTDYTDFGGTFLFIYNLFTDPENNETHRTNSIALGSPWEYPTALISKCEVTASLFKACEVLKKNSSNCIKFMFIKL